MKNLTAHIQLRGFDDYSTAFDYNTDTGECELQRHSWGTVTHKIKYGTLKDMLNDIENKGYKIIFEL